MISNQIIYYIHKLLAITITKGKSVGQPCIHNLRIAVGDIISYLAPGMTQEEILDDFPELTQADILAALQLQPTK